MIEQTALLSEPPAANAPSGHPSRLGLWLLTLSLGGSYLLIQLVVTLPVLAWMLATGQLARRQDALNSPVLIMTALIGVAIAGSVTIGVALAWPKIWGRISHSANLTLAEWVGWRPVHTIPLWVVAVVTPFLVIGLSVGVALALHETEPNLQAKLFQSDASRIVASLVVITFVPVAEELIFRGALFNAVLPDRGSGDDEPSGETDAATMTDATEERPDAEEQTGAPATKRLKAEIDKRLPFWRRYWLPITVSAVIFAAIHRISGVDTLAGMVEITILSFYLSWLRATTGSVRASMVAHFTWNLLGAVALSASSMKF